jgi:hypothetical protein
MKIVILQFKNYNDKLMNNVISLSQQLGGEINLLEKVTQKYETLQFIFQDDQNSEIFFKHFTENKNVFVFRHGPKTDSLKLLELANKCSELNNLQKTNNVRHNETSVKKPLINQISSQKKKTNSSSVEISKHTIKPETFTKDKLLGNKRKITPVNDIHFNLKK